MKVLSGDISCMEPLVDSLTVTMGNFDGVHLGHSHLIGQLKKRAVESRTQTAVLCFEPHPSEVLAPESFLGRLSTPEGRSRAIEALGVDYLVVQDFNLAFAQVSREDFLRQYLLPFFKPKALLFGYDFRFGREGLGDFDFAQSWMNPIPVTKASPLMVEGRNVSSTLIRKELLDGQLQCAEKLLGRPYSITGVVEPGQALGRTLGFPTANLGGIQTLSPKDGVYAGYAFVDEKRFRAVLNIGKRPTLGKEQARTFECHLLDFSGSLYGLPLRFEFYQKIRSERKFDGLESLKEQISKDLVMVSEVLEKNDQTLGNS